MVRSALLCSMPAVGHVTPMLVVARELSRRGWRVRMLTGSRYEPLVRRAGIEFVALPADADTLDDVGSEGRNRGLATINRGVEEAFIDPAGPASRRLEELLDAEPVDVVIHDMTFLGVQTLFGRAPAERPRTVLCGVGPAGFSSRDTAPYGLGITPLQNSFLNRARNRVLNRIAPRVLRPAHRSLDAFLRDVGAPPLQGAFFMDVLARSDLLAHFTVPEFEYVRRDGPPNLAFYGPMVEDDSDAPPKPAWFDDLDPALPLVHVTQGTVANTDFSEVIEPTLQALAEEPVQVAVTTGGRPLGALPALPANAFAAPYLPYDDLLARTRVMVTNGGYGGLHHAMRHGVPLVIAGDSEDKVETSARVQYSGVGINLRTGTPQSSAIRRAVRTILAEPRYAATSRRLGASIAASRGVRGLVDDVTALVDAAEVPPNT